VTGGATEAAPRPLLLFAPGAGAPSTSAWMAAWRDRLAAVGRVVTFDYPYMQKGRRSPDRLPALVAAHRQALAEARVGVGVGVGEAIFLIGKSMGGRIGCHLAVEELAARDRAAAIPIAGVIALGYPLRSASSGALRDQVLLALRTPILFVQGTRDPLCALDELETVRAKMTVPSMLFVVDGGDHSLELLARQRKATGETQEGSDARVLEAIAAFVRSIAGQRAG
jgi:hypothetical protein